MLVTDDTGNASLNSACITSNAVFSHLIFHEKRKIYLDSTQKLLDISLQFFLQVRIYNVYFKPIPGFVDIRLKSRTKVMKGIKATPKPFFDKYVIFWKLYHISIITGTGLRASYI